jgi:REP element-mobilizing transposase RayT
MKNKNRKNLRLPYYDYSQADANFITIVTANRKCLFGSIVNGKIILNGAGQMIDSVCHEFPQFFPSVFFEPYIIMPNHFHAVVVIESNYFGKDPSMSPEGYDARLMDLEGRSKTIYSTKSYEMEKSPISLPELVKCFKSLTTRRYIDGVERYDWPRFDKRLWQRNYYEHVIRDESDYEVIADYILVNPQNWEKDPENVNG